ncbi:hypothetical protein Taro_027710 [Colocasia esculenta]|uniref:Retrotransposon gag domain-containing protein n=1 Tax=Colocasia esculenta TaxID=4460 RepID=A0A843VPL4_COLES|nr:hypothetical protein [Colocasia esculenta]
MLANLQQVLVRMEQNQHAPPAHGEALVQPVVPTAEVQGGLGNADPRYAQPTMLASHAEDQRLPQVTVVQGPRQADAPSPAIPVVPAKPAARTDVIDLFSAESTPAPTNVRAVDPRWKDDLQEMNRKIDALQREVTSALVPDKLQLPKFRRYNGTMNPIHHLDHFQGQVEMVNITDALKCRAFMSTLDDAALQWFKSLPSRSIASFADLAQRFLDHFYNTVQYSLCTNDLWLVSQKEGEMFRDFVKRFRLEVMKVVDLDLRTVVNILTRVCSNAPFVASIAKKPPGHERRCYNVFRLHPTTFMRLRDELMERDLIRDSRYVTATEKLAIFMYAMGHGVTSGAMCEFFQHSSETINKHIREVTKALASLRFNYIKLPSLTDPVHPRIRHDDRFYPYFKILSCTTNEGDY